MVLFFFHPTFIQGSRVHTHIDFYLQIPPTHLRNNLPRRRSFVAQAEHKMSWGLKKGGYAYMLPTISQ